MGVEDAVDDDAAVNIGDIIRHQYPRLLKNFEHLLLEPEMIHAGPDGDNVEPERIVAFKGQVRRAVDCLASSLPDLPHLEEVQEENGGVAAGAAGAVSHPEQEDPKLHAYVILSLRIQCTVDASAAFI